MHARLASGVLNELHAKEGEGGGPRFRNAYGFLSMVDLVDARLITLSSVQRLKKKYAANGTVYWRSDAGRHVACTNITGATKQIFLSSRF